ncbi:fatty acid-binding protein DegV [Clostridium carboxidivorans P7]|uniref:DegV family protein n=1 Tax=Clostridium carboxidivorans TaxID=217159 RepID=UPI0001D39049|nr:DegV family protein [Clostridium carboxidivorans]AKN29520.1 fatty acid-binding protein DegV [Clostridium carboxidivorans P7]EFG89555.1 EDD domain protein, DegV family [Clostridium carboxidivorans P7]
MKDFIIITDSCCDLPISYINNLKIPYVSLTCNCKGKEVLDDFGKSYPFKDFYEDMRKGEIPKTSQPSSHAFYNSFKEILELGKDILYIGVSSGLSGTTNGAHIAKHMLEEEYPDSNIHIIDILTASLGQGIMVLQAYEMQKSGKTLKEIMDYLENVKQQLNTYIIVDDINHLKRGGRISATSAFVGMLLNIKPFLTISNIGKVLPIGKIRGRKKALSTLFEKFIERIENPEDQIIAISHGDCIEDALALKKLILNKFKIKDVIINYVGPVVGAYGGPGALALFFLGKKREIHAN